MTDGASEALDEALKDLERQRKALMEDSDEFFFRIAGPIDRLSEIAGEQKRDARDLVREKRNEKAKDVSP